MTTKPIVKEKATPKKVGRYATPEEAAKEKNGALVALLKKLDVKVVPAS